MMHRYSCTLYRPISTMKSLATPLYKLHWLLFVSVHTNLQDLIPTLALLVIAYNYGAKVGINLVDLHEQTQIVASTACRVG